MTTEAQQRAAQEIAKSALTYAEDGSRMHILAEAFLAAEARVAELENERRFFCSECGASIFPVNVVGVPVAPKEET